MSRGRSTAATANIVVALLYVTGLGLVAWWPEHVDKDIPVMDWWITGAVADLFDTSRRTVYGWIEWWSNVLLFIPFGWFVTTLVTRRAWWAAVVIGCCCSVLIEAGQGLLLSGRTAATSDVLANSLGAAIGAAIGLLLVRDARRVT